MIKPAALSVGSPFGGAETLDSNGREIFLESSVSMSAGCSPRRQSSLSGRWSAGLAVMEIRYLSFHLFF